MNRSLQHMFLDIDETLYPTSTFVRGARRQAITAMVEAGLEADVESLLHELDEVIIEFGSNFGFHYDRLLSRLDQKCFHGLNPDYLVAVAVVAYNDATPQSLRPFEDALDVLRIIKDRCDFSLGIISNGLTHKQMAKLARLGVGPLLRQDAIFISDSVGVAKPNPKIFIKACQDLGVEPRACVMIGDDPIRDIDPAHKLGMKTVWVKRSPDRHSMEGQHPADLEIQNYWDLIPWLKDTWGYEL